ncbi:Oidioi.mRNA.OKI2018_I69.chr1.g1274.t1.cds [Oikopleura dioica]|uniref:Oidioi.mRNA.OKI2018_I69.chr1.g1274.t1.cds n=1 Tax=Oikopleura dioica TaxID=34765 RepID=A0ABN7SMF1_OIKDI|nr:Oidioi.mRNA.OKI2018_I69.chr1.g1274.t1.cds [Oikopleura dioica]
MKIFSLFAAVLGADFSTMHIPNAVRRGFSPYSMLMKNNYFKRSIDDSDTNQLNEDWQTLFNSASSDEQLRLNAMLNRFNGYLQ